MSWDRRSRYCRDVADTSHSRRRPIVLRPGEGRHYDMSGMRAMFKADGDETGSMYNISEWWLDPHTDGPPAHQHDEDDVFYVIEGTVDFLVGEEWMSAPRGSFVLASGGVTHTFRNSSDEPAGFLNIGAPGGFEAEMPGEAIGDNV